MQVPEHIISLYVATCGQSGPALGSDEKEIILLVYAVIDVPTAEIIGTKQFLVQPDGNLVRAANAIETSITNSTQQQALKYGVACNNNNNNNLNNNNIINNNNNNNNNIINNNNNTCTNLATIQPLNSMNTGNIFKEKNNNTIENGAVVVALEETMVELPPIAMAQATGIPLHESLKEFDEYMRSLSLNENDIILITDGQLPLRQCLHREACVKDIELPLYYNKFCDLRKEFVRYKNGDLSCALVPVKDIKKILQMPTMPMPQSIAEMMTDLGLSTTQDNTFYMRESRDMITVIQTMLKNGHKFIANEVVNLILEPGICSIDDEIDGDCIVRARGLPWQSSDQDIAKFFRGLNVANGGVALCLSPLGRRNGEALVRFISQEHRDMALKRHKHHIGNRYIEVYRATGEDFLAVAGGASNEAQSFLSKGAQVIIRMRGLPYDCTAKQVLDFFTTGDSPCDVHDGAEGVLFVKKPDGRATGDAFVLFSKELDAPKALSRHRECIGQRYIELFRSTTAEVQQVLNRSMDSKTFENNNNNNNNNNLNHNAPALIAQLPSVQLSLLPQHLITSGTTKNCIRLRGLPYEAQVEHILHFLDDFAKHIIYQGVHMVINAQGQPSGEAFIQMESEDAARLCAQRKHNQFMVFGKKYRYIEVFQCSGDDMNMVLNGGLQSPLGTHQPPPHAALVQQKAVVAAAAAASLVSPGMLAQTSPSTAQAISCAHLNTHAHPNAHSSTLSHDNPALQATPTGLAAAMSALSQNSHLSTAPPVSLAASTNAPSAAAVSYMNSMQHASVPPPALTATSPYTNAPLHNANTALGLQTSANSHANHAAAMSFNPFNLPPHMASAANAQHLVAQQQAQFIAQQNLLARQAAASMMDQHPFLTNALMHPLLMQNAHAAGSPHNMSGAGGQSQFLLMPRPYAFPSLPMGYMPTPGYQFHHGMTPGAGLPHAAVAAAAQAQAQQALMPSHALKRSFDNAFQDDPSATSAAKRALTRPPNNPGFYTFYNSSI